MTNRPTYYVNGQPINGSNYTASRNSIMNEPEASYWLKTAISTLEARDPIDAVSDVELLLALAEARMEKVFGKAKEAAR